MTWVHLGLDDGTDLPVCLSAQQRASCGKHETAAWVVTSISVAIALVIGIIEPLKVTIGLQVLDLGKIGYLVVALFFVTWAVSVVYWKARRVEERWTG